MFGAKYSRLAFWIWSIILLIPFSLLSTFSRTMEMSPETADLSLVFRGLALIVVIMWINALANRIRDYGSNPWIAVFSIIPLANIGLALYYGIVQYIKKPEGNDKTINHSNPSLTKAVYNHAKDIAAEVKPTISEYKQKHTTSQTQVENQDIDLVDEDAIYEQVMLEIEEDKKVKATWAKALAQSDGDRDKAESLYIKFRVGEIKNLQAIKHQEKKIITETNSDDTVQKTFLLETEKNTTAIINNTKNGSNNDITQDQYTLLRQFLDKEKENGTSAKTVIECSNETGIEISKINNWFSENMILGYKQDVNYYIKTDQSGLANGEINAIKQESNWIYPVGLVVFIAALIIFPFPLNTIIAVITPFILFYMNKAVSSPVKKIV